MRRRSRIAARLNELERQLERMVPALDTALAEPGVSELVEEACDLIDIAARRLIGARLPIER